MLNKLLQRQLHKHFGSLEQVPENLSDFLKVISESYDHYEKDRNMLERSIDLTSAEMVDLNDKLRHEAEELKEAQKKLERANGELKRLFNNIHEALFSVDMVSYRLIQMSDACTQIYGYTPDEFYSKANLWQEIIYPEDRHISEAQVEMLYQGMQVFNQYRIVHKDGSIRWVENSVIPTLDSEGKLLRLDGITTDITERREAEEALQRSEEKYKLLFYASPLPKWIYDIETLQILDVNQAAINHYGYTWKEFTAMTIIDIRPAEDIPKLLDSNKKKVIKDGIVHFGVWTHTKKNQEHIKVEVAGHNLYYNDRDCMIVVCYDVTQRLAAEEQLNILNRQLEKRAEELATSNAELEHFAFVASHDLQEPLRMVSSFLQLLKRKYEPQLDETGLKYIHIAVDGAERMKQLINDLLQYSRVGREVMELTPVDMNLLMEEVLRMFKDDHNADISIGPLPVINAGKTAMIQLMQNLVGNALKYRSDEKPVIHISATENEEAWTFYVKDNGIGIDPRFAEKIFVVFQRLHNKDEYSGTGIGLAICKKIVERYKGKIWVESEPGKGSTFVFTISKHHEVI